MTHERQFAKITGKSFTAQCASCGYSQDALQMYFDCDKGSDKYKAHYCSPCACMLRIASQDAIARETGEEMHDIRCTCTAHVDVLCPLHGTRATACPQCREITANFRWDDTPDYCSQLCADSALKGL